MAADAPLPVRGGGWSFRGRLRRLAPGHGWLLASRIALVLVGAITLMVLGLAVGMRVDDRQIDRHLGTATATVLTISPLRTGIEFVDGAGVSIRPPNGVLYPGLLSAGQQFMVDYSTLDPTVVRVAGRTAAVGDLLLGLTLIITWSMGAVLVWRLRATARSRATPGGQLTSATA